MMEHVLNVFLLASLMRRKNVNQSKMDVFTNLEDVNFAVLLSSLIKLHQFV
jgi:hypothetical protein